MKSVDSSSCYNISNYDTSFSIQGLNKTIEEAEKRIISNNFNFVKDITQYFNKTYNLYLEYQEPKEFPLDGWRQTTEIMEQKAIYQSRNLSYIDIVEDFVSQVGSFDDSGKEQVIIDFRGTVDYLSEYRAREENKDAYSFTCEQKKNKIIFKNHRLYQEYYSSNVSRHEKLIKVLNLFFNDEISTVDNYFKLEDRFKTPISGVVYESEKVKIKSFQNARLDITFKSETIARNFWNFTRLNQKAK